MWQDRRESTRSRDWLQKYLLDPSSMIEGAKMPGVEATPEELKPLLDYLMSLQ